MADAHSKKPSKHHTMHSHIESGHEGGEHSEDWLISYADLMTLLVGFFVILLSFANVDEEKFKEAAKSVTQKFGGNYEDPFGEIAGKLKAALKEAEMKQQIVVTPTNSGVEVSFLGTAFFNPGSADFKNEAKAIFDNLIPAIKNDAKLYEIVIEGHTDDIPLAPGGTYKNNFELSSIRACRVLDYFSAAGFDKQHLTAIGYGETKPVVPNRDSEGQSIPANQSQNRRVVVKISKREAKSL